MKKSISRIEAMKNGEDVYVPESPCIRGHLLRKTSTGSCIECKRIAERNRTEENREAYNARKRKERQKKLPELAEKMRQIRANESPEKRAARLERARIRQREWRAKNVGHIGAKLAKKKYKQNNASLVRADTVRRRASKMKRTPAWLTDEDFWMIEQAYEIAKIRTKVFGFAWHVDHVIPLQGKTVSGLHVPNNLQVIPWLDNVVKANKYLPA